MKSESPYNPLDKLNLGKSVADALLRSPVTNMSTITDTTGAGVYAIYYTGEFTAYTPIATKNREGQFKQPIYVGKAIPKGGRKGGLGTDAELGTALRDRLRQHSVSINQATNLSIDDFFYRRLVVDDIWIPLGENMLIETFHPIWNLVIDGFGNKDPGNRRAAQYRSSWDVLHPGRQFAVKLANGSTTVEMLVAKIESFHAGKPVQLINGEDNGD